MSQRIRKEPARYRLALAANLAVSAGEVSTETATLQEIADLLVDELRDQPAGGAELALKNLAESAFYRHIRVSQDSTLFRAQLAKLDDQARRRANADFTLTDTNGKAWHLKGIHGQVVLVNFWATWCHPCQREMAEFQEMYNRFSDKGLLILAVTGEDVATVKHYQADKPVTFPTLLDPGELTQKQFLIDGFPPSVLYNGEGKLVAQFTGPPTREQLIGAFGKAELR